MKKHSFITDLRREPVKGAWTYLSIPFDVEKEFGNKGFVKVRGSIDNTPFQGINLMPVGERRHVLNLKKEIREALGKQKGEQVQVILEVDLTEPEIPLDLKKAIRISRKCQKFFEGMTEGEKYHYINWIISAKREQTRRGRVEKTIARLEQELRFTD